VPAPDAFISHGLGRVVGVAALVALLAYTCLQVGLYGAFGPSAAGEAAAHLHLHAARRAWALAAWAMAAHTGQGHVVAAAGQEGPGLLFSLGGSASSQAAQVLFLTSLFAAALAFHNCVWRYMFALGREGVLPAALARTGEASSQRTRRLYQRHRYGDHGLPIRLPGDVPGVEKTPRGLARGTGAGWGQEALFHRGGDHLAGVGAEWG